MFNQLARFHFTFEIKIGVINCLRMECTSFSTENKHGKNLKTDSLLQPCAGSIILRVGHKTDLTENHFHA